MKYSTNHSSLRAKQRLGLSATKADRQFALALRYGKSAADFNHSYQSLYLQKREVSARNITTRAYVYDDFCYIFAADCDTCITTFPLPKWFNRGIACDGKERIRNVRKYQRLNPDCEAVA